MIMIEITNTDYPDKINSQLQALEEFWNQQEPFIAWVMSFFRDGDHLDRLVSQAEAFERYRQCLSDRARSFVTPKVWKWHLQAFCKAAGWEWCPEDVHQDIFRKDRGEYVWYDGWSGRTVNGFYIRTSRKEQ